jgi:hypothetical protein
MEDEVDTPKPLEQRRRQLGQELGAVGIRDHANADHPFNCRLLEQSHRSLDIMARFAF